jgi:hypothetical protein
LFLRKLLSPPDILPLGALLAHFDHGAKIVAHRLQAVKQVARMSEATCGIRSDCRSVPFANAAPDFASLIRATAAGLPVHLRYLNFPVLDRRIFHFQAGIEPRV